MRGLDPRIQERGAISGTTRAADKRDHEPHLVRAWIRGSSPRVTIHSGSIIAVDGDIFLREIAGPDRRLPFAKADIDANADFRLLHNL